MSRFHSVSTIAFSDKEFEDKSGTGSDKTFSYLFRLFPFFQILIGI